ncbi:MAG: polymerase sigma factor SigM, partial [Frankiales bacterium]|nr:polymerase sigma factor SigM [Frankiales bacterium]
MTEPEDADRALLTAHVEGDPHAFDQLIRQHRQRMWAIAVRT